MPPIVVDAACLSVWLVVTTAAVSAAWGLGQIVTGGRRRRSPE
jgi:hypothetical protein